MGRGRRTGPGALVPDQAYEAPGSVTGAIEPHGARHRELGQGGTGRGEARRGEAGRGEAGRGGAVLDRARRRC